MNKSIKSIKIVNDINSTKITQINYKQNADSNCIIEYVNYKKCH